ncbi:MAG: radical SAM protein [Acidobacteria bacterium]|nr:radical SAM protein [Acidobacteriota bacterium]
MQMVNQPRLFDLAGRPTTRAVARAVREAGVGDLPGGVRRGDNTVYQEIVCRSALNRVEGMPFRWTLNPYRGCTHGCHYCFARRYQSQLELGAGDDFSSVVLVKSNFPDVLERELSRRPLDGQMVALGTATDPYQPIEGRHRLTRRTLSVLIPHATPVGLITKGTLVVRDTDLLVELSRRTRCTVTFSLPTVDVDAWRSLEPGTADPLQRLRALRRLRHAGVDAGVLMAPIVPGISSKPAGIERTLKAIADSGASHVGALLLHLEGDTRRHFLRFLSREYPQLVAGYGRLYAGKHASASYATRFRTVMGALMAKYGLESKDRSGPEQRTSRPSISDRSRPHQYGLGFPESLRPFPAARGYAAPSAGGC